MQKYYISCELILSNKQQTLYYSLTKQMLYKQLNSFWRIFVYVKHIKTLKIWFVAHKYNDKTITGWWWETVPINLTTFLY